MKNIDSTVFLARGSITEGNIKIGRNSSVWFNTVIRAEKEPIEIGADTNIQDNCVVHVSSGYPVTIGNGVTVGHGAIVHGCTIGDNSLIGMGAIVLNGAVVGKDCLVAAGSLVTQGTVVEDGSLLMGSPARVVRKLTGEEIQKNKDNALEYVLEVKSYLTGQ